MICKNCAEGIHPEKCDCPCQHKPPGDHGYRKAEDE